MRVREVMTPSVEVVLAWAPLMDAAAYMVARGVDALPVCEDGRLVGMLVGRDVARRAASAGCDPHTATVRDLVTPDLPLCYDDQGCAEAERLMQARKISRAVVLDRDNRLVGVVSRDDIMPLSCDCVPHTPRRAVHSILKDAGRGGCQSPEKSTDSGARGVRRATAERLS